MRTKRLDGCLREGYSSSWTLVQQEQISLAAVAVRYELAMSLVQGQHLASAEPEVHIDASLLKGPKYRVLLASPPSHLQGIHLLVPV